MQSYVTPQAGLNGQQGYSSMSPELLAQFQQWQAMQQQAQAGAQAPDQAGGGMDMQQAMMMGLLPALMGQSGGPGGLSDIFGGFGMGKIAGLLGGS